jgi:hypothetical protein
MQSPDYRLLSPSFEALFHLVREERSPSLTTALPLAAKLVTMTAQSRFLSVTFGAGIGEFAFGQSLD